VTLAQLEAVPVWRQLMAAQGHAALTPEQEKYLGVRALINDQVEDLARNVEARIAEWDLDSPDAVRRAPGPAVALSPEMAARNEELRRFLQEYVYRDYRVGRMSVKARRILTELFGSYEAHPEQLPPAAEGGGEPLHRRLCD